LKTSGFNLKVENYLADYLSCQLIENAELKEILILQNHLINNLEVKFGDEVKNKGFIKLPEHQDLKLFALKMMMTSLNQICIVYTVLESECCYISSTILTLIYATLLGSCQVYGQGINGCLF
jgi:energy-converting hydrogenase Eha subunit G